MSQCPSCKRKQGASIADGGCICGQTINCALCGKSEDGKFAAETRAFGRFRRGVCFECAEAAHIAEYEIPTATMEFHAWALLASMEAQTRHGEVTDDTKGMLQFARQELGKLQSIKTRWRDFP